MNESVNGGLEPPRLLLLDYPGRRPEPRISELGLDQRGYRPTELITTSPPEEVTAREYAERVLADSRVTHRGAAAILAYCAAAALGQECARILVEEGGEPLPLILFNASPVTVRDVREFYESALCRLLPGVDVDTGSVVDVAPLIATPRALLDAVRADLTVRAREALLAKGFAGDDIDVVVDHAVKVYTDWLSHLLAAHHHASPDWGGRVLHVVSSDHSYREPWVGARSTRTMEIGCDRMSLLRSEQARAAVLSFLRESDVDEGPKGHRGRTEAGR